MRDDRMQRDNIVIKTSVVHDGTEYSASYFVEGEHIHAHVDGRIMLLPVGRRPPDVTVRSVLRGMLGKKGRAQGSPTRFF